MYEQDKHTCQKERRHRDTFFYLVYYSYYQKFIIVRFVLKRKHDFKTKAFYILTSTISIKPIVKNNMTRKNMQDDCLLLLAKIHSYFYDKDYHMK